MTITTQPNPLISNVAEKTTATELDRIVILDSEDENRTKLITHQHLFRLISPNGTEWEISVDNSGALITTAVSSIYLRVTQAGDIRITQDGSMRIQNG